MAQAPQPQAASADASKGRQHTPGPWSFQQMDAEGLDVFLMQGPPGDQSGSIYEGGFTRDAAENAANMFLIEAAPDMLKALKNMTYALQVAANGADLGIFALKVQRTQEAARAAIAKAEGQ